MYLWTASIRKEATAAFAIPDIAWLPFGNFRLKMEKTAKVRSSRPTPEIIVIIVHNLHKTLCLKYPCVGTVCRVPTRLTMPKL